MPCRTFPLPGGAAIVCPRGQKRKLCSVPNCTGTQIALCDYPVTRAGMAGTCDKGMCATHRHHVGPDVDHCPAHAKLANEAAGGSP